MKPMAEKLAVCDECSSLFFKGTSQMESLCPEYAHLNEDGFFRQVIQRDIQHNMKMPRKIFCTAFSVYTFYV